MRAAVVERYGPPEVVAVSEVPPPSPRRGQVLVKVEAAAVSSGDARIRGANYPSPAYGFMAKAIFGFRGPRRPILGAAVSGTVAASDDPTLPVGTAVSGMAGMRLGGHAEFSLLRASALVPKPASVSHADAAAALFGGTTALHFLRDRVTPGCSVLVNGASGSVGCSAVQLATYLGGVVTAVTSGRNHDLVVKLGADHVVDYSVSPVHGLTERYDVVLDAVGNISRETGLALLRPDGWLLLVVAGLADTVRARGHVVAGPAGEKPSDVALLLDLLAEGRFDPVTDALGGLDAVPEAYRRIDSGHKVGNLVVLPPA